MDDMLKDFVVEASELAEKVEEDLLQLERSPNDKETLNAIFRSFHTIKGGAGFMSLSAMVSACHLTENLFDALRTGRAPVTPAAIEAALQASGFVASQLSALGNGAEPKDLPALPQSLEAALTRAIAGETAVVEVDVQAQSFPNDSDGGSAIDWISLYNAVTRRESAGAIDPLSADQQSSAITSLKPTPAKEGGWDGVDRRASTSSVKEDSIRIDAAKLDSLLEIAGESVQAANQSNALLEKLLQYKMVDPGAADLISKLAETLSRAARYSSDLQRATLATRMQPVGKLFQKFPRMVRDLAKDLGKDVDLLIEGAETEVDRVVVDSLYDPLVHMLRNALDHGVEDSSARTASGKPAKACISLKAWQEANSVMIEISDDGKGMDPTQIRKKALDKGLIGPGDAQSDKESLQLIFLPGFSTKDVASSVSGRGVGMDVVKTAVEKNRGTISIDSEKGAGSRFLIRLPIELSIVPTMLVRTSGAALGIPMALVQRVVELPENLKGVGGSPVLVDQGLPLPVLSLAGVLGYPTANEEKAGVVMNATPPYILAVNAVEGAADVVIKPLTAVPVHGLTGTARSAEGELILIVDLAFILSGCKPLKQVRQAI